MFETLAVLVVVLLCAVLVFVKARERLKHPGARRSRDGDGDAGDGGDGGGGD